MAGYEDKEDRGDQADSADLIQKINRRVGLNRMLAVVVLIVSMLVIAVMTTGMMVMFSRIATLEAAVAAADQANPLQEQFAALEHQLMLLANFRKSELKKIAAYTQQIESVQNDCRVEKVAAYQAFLASREQDFSRLVSSVKVGATNLAAMNKGSKSWLDGYTKTLDELAVRSRERKTKLDMLLDGATNE